MPYNQTTKSLDAETTASAYGSWVATGSASSISVHTDGIVTNDKVKIFQSNHPTAPATANQIIFGSELTADGITAVTTIAKWLRCQLSAATGGGSVTTYVHVAVND